MKSAIAFLAAALLAAMPAAAQQHQQPQPHPAGHPTTHAPAPAMHTVHPTTHTHVTAHHVTTHHVVHHHVTTHRVVHHVYHHAVHHAVRAAARPGHRAPRAVVMKVRKNVVAAHRFHAGPYRAPRGWVYRRWVFGERLPGIYFAPGFWISDFLAFDLFAPPDGYVWVRYGPDAMMIDQYTGEIIQVQYGVFF
jgi:Ni/Co efflux regulator RcnB